MALSTSSTVRKELTPGYTLKPSGLQIIAQYLVPKALHGGTTIPPSSGYVVVEGVDVFSVKPGALPFHWRRDGEAWGYFSAAAHPAGDARPAPGGCWLLYGADKTYFYDYGYGAREVVAFRRRFAFHVAQMGDDDDRSVAWTPTMWLMKEYRLNKDAAIFQRALKNPDADVVVKVFLKPLVSPPPPSSSSQEESGYASDEDREMKRCGCSIEGRTSKRARFR